MTESPRPSDVGDERTPVATEAEQSSTPPDPASESGATGAVARYPIWLIVGAVVIFALVALYLAWILVPAGP